VWFIILAGAGMGLMLGPAQTDAVNRASRFAYGEATGITQTVRNYAGSLGLAILGTILVSQLRSRLTTSLIAQHLPARVAAAHASMIAQSQGAGSAGAIPRFVRLDFADATRTVLTVMAAIMAAGALVSLVGLRRGAQEETPVSADDSLSPTNLPVGATPTASPQTPAMKSIPEVH
jgi:methionine-rich copper-binding protein CopC